MNNIESMNLDSIINGNVSLGGTYGTLGLGPSVGSGGLANGSLGLGSASSVGSLGGGMLSSSSNASDSLMSSSLDDLSSPSFAHHLGNGGGGGATGNGSSHTAHLNHNRYVRMRVLNLSSITFGSHPVGLCIVEYIFQLYLILIFSR